jgi:hypothetical protein
VTQSQVSKTRTSVKTDQLTEKQNQGNLATQSHGSKVDDQDCQTTKEQK